MKTLAKKKFVIFTIVVASYCNALHHTDSTRPTTNSDYKLQQNNDNLFVPTQTVYEIENLNALAGIEQIPFWTKEGGEC